VSNKQSYYYALSFPFNERVDMSELYEAKWNSNNDSKRERERANEGKTVSYCSDSRVFSPYVRKRKKYKEIAHPS
jgi:hypothetical protein